MSNPANPQSFNRYSYCLNNPLKYIDPSGLTDVVVTQQELPPDLAAYAALLGLSLDTVYTIANTATSAQMNFIAYSLSNNGELPVAVYEFSNMMRQEAGDTTLNIFWTYEDLFLIDHYAYDKSVKPTLTEQYYINSSGRLELIHSTNCKDPCSWGNILRYTAGGLLEALGLFVMTIGTGVTIAAFTPTPVAGWGVEVGLGIIGVGGGLFSLAWELLTEGEGDMHIYIPIPY